MQKKLIALAIAGLASTAAFAQSNVTLYGVADAYVGSFSKDGIQNSLQVNSGGLATSRLGFKGVEDLGGGLKALFVLEYRLEIDGNNPVGFTSSVAASGPARQQMLGLTGDFGTAVAGRLQTTAYDWAVKYDVLAGTAISPLQNVQGTKFNISGSAGDARADNALAYISPSFGGVTLAANYALAVENTAANTAANNKITATLLSATYENGPLSAGLVYDAHSADVNAYAASTLQSGKDWAFGASYNFGVATLKATYQTSKVADAAAAPASVTNKAYSLGVAAPVSAAGTIIASYASFKQNQTAANDDVKSWTLAYTHALSKRTTAYAGYTKVNDDRATVTVGPVGTAGNVYNTMSALVAGINHKF